MAQPPYYPETALFQSPFPQTNTGSVQWAPPQPPVSTQPIQSSQRPQVQPTRGPSVNSGSPKKRKLRPLTVNEALQYSPLSSLVSLDSSVIPAANAQIPYSQPIFANQKELRAARQTLDAIDQSLINGNGHSSLASSALATLQPLLQKNRVPEFNFKVPSELRASPSKKSTSKSDTIVVGQANRLRPFASMVLNGSKVGYTPSPTATASDIITVDAKPSTPKKQKLPLTPTTSKALAHNEVAFAQNANIPVADDLQRPKPATNGIQVHHSMANGAVNDNKHPPPKPMVLIPPLPSTSDPSRYKVFPDGEQTEVHSTSVSRKRKREDGEKINVKPSIMVQIKDPKSSSNAALYSLQEVLTEVFEVETSGELDGSSSLEGHFIVHKGSEDRILLLTTMAHVKIDSALQKVVSLGRMGDIPLDQLCRLQKLCERTLSTTEDLNIHIETARDSEDVSKWLEDLTAVELGLRAARSALRVMTAGREEKQIYPEELLQKILDLLSKVMDHCIVPVVESRKAGSSSDTFDFASNHKKTIAQILYAAGKVTHLLAELLVQVELTETTINAIEYFVARMLFVENAHSEKDSVMDPHRFEAFRRTAMDVLAEIFSRYNDQRGFIITEILSSLQKLPVSRQQARQFKLGDGKAIQLVSALIMRLVQTSGMRLASKLPKQRVSEGQDERNSSRADSVDADGDDEEDEDSDDSNDSIPRRRTKLKVTADSQDHIGEIETLYKSASRAAQQVVNFLVARASTASKSGDQPHRNLLDIFVEDLIAVLGLSDWPASEVLLRALLVQLGGIVKSDKSTAPAKTMALELYGLMGCAIVDTTDAARHLTKSLEADDSSFGAYLVQMTDDFLDSDLENGAIFAWKGPYCAVIESLHLRSGEDRQLASAEGFLLTQWSRAVLSEAEESERRASQSDPAVAVKLTQVLSAGKWLGVEDFGPITSNQCKLAYTLIVLHSGFCRAFIHIIDTLLDFIRSDQISVRTRSLKSVTQLLEKDPTFLDRNPHFIKVIINCTSDSSTQVRDSALALIGKIMVLKPALEVEVCKSILNLSSDTAVGIRKRSMKLLKDIYCRSNRKELKVVIADSLMQRTRDVEESVAEVARQMFEEMWLSPFWSTNSKADSPQTTVALKEQVSLLVKTAQRGENVRSILDSVLTQILSSKSKNMDANTSVCKAMVADCFDGVIDSTSLGDNMDQRQILQLLTVFAKANPRLFTQSQLRLLQPYITSLATTDDLNLFRLVVIILRHVLPTLSAVQHDFLEAIQRDLLVNMVKLAKSELNEVVACLWTISCELKNVEKLVRPTMATVQNLYQNRSASFTEPSGDKLQLKVTRLICVASHLGKHCDLEPQLERFKASLQWYTGGSVSELIVDSIMPFTEQQLPLKLREAAFDGVGLMCQAWPKNFNRPKIARTFQKVLKDDEPEIQQIVLLSFRDFFAAQDQGNSLKPPGNKQVPNDDGRLGGSLTANDNDGAAALIAQAFLKDVLRISLATQDTYALAATEVIASITRQGLVHPKECGPALVALETSTNPKIAEVAFQEHRNLHQQHESMFEREYMRAINEAFIYQRDIVKDPLGAVSQPLKAKLGSMFEIIKTSKAKYQVKFLSNFCSKIDFDLTKLDASLNPPAHLEYSRFLVENLAFFEYGRIEELQYTIGCLEKLAAGTGAGVAHAINTEVFQVTVESVLRNSQEPLPSGPTTDQPTITEITPERLRQLCTASMILSMVWETRTFLRRLYGVKPQKAENKSKATSKDASKAPTKVNGVYGEKYMQAIAKIACSLGNRESIMEQCKKFAELMAIDDEVKVAGESPESFDERPETPLLDTDGDTMMVGSAQSKKSKGRGPVSANGTPHKPKRGRPSLGGRKKSTGGRSRGSVDDGEDSY